MDEKFNIKIENTDSSLLKILDKYQQSSKGNFRFSLLNNTGKGVIISINGLSTDEAGQWIVSRQYNGKCIPIDSQKYIPRKGDKIILAFVTTDSAHNLFSCFKDTDSVKITVKSYVSNFQFEERHFGISFKRNEALIETLTRLQEDNQDFRFETVLYPGLGKMITSVGPIKQNATLETYWGLGKQNEENMCLLSVGG